MFCGIALTIAISVGVTAAESPIADAAARGDREAVKALLKKAADVNAAQGDGMTALHWAAMNRDVDLVQMLIVAGANVRATTRLGTYTPLYLASQQGHAPVIQALVSAGLDQGLNDMAVPLLAGEIQRRVGAESRRRLDVGARGDQHLRELGVAVHRRPVQRRHAVALSGIHVSRILQQRLDGVAIATRRRIRDR